MHAKQQNRMIIGLAVLLIIGGMYLGRVTESDIAACVNATGWSADKCAIELHR